MYMYCKYNYIIILKNFCFYRKINFIVRSISTFSEKNEKFGIKIKAVKSSYPQIKIVHQ